MKKIIIISSLFATLAILTGSVQADLFYTPSEYKSIYNEKITLELELKHLKNQYANDRTNLLDEQKDMLVRISTLEGKILFMEKQLEDEAAINAKNIASLEKTLAITKSNSGEKVKALLDENRRAGNQSREDIEKYKDRLARESDAHLKKVEELSIASNKKISDLEFLISDLRGENAGLKKLTATQKEGLSRMGKQAEDLEKQLGEEIRKGDIRIRRYHDRIVININNNILFESGSANLRKSVHTSLDKIKDILTGYPENKTMVEGHTDNIPISTPSFRDNWQLSTERALAVLNYILRNKRLKPERFSAAGYGEFSPMVPNDTAANRALNRRVDITLLPSISK